MNNPTSKSEPLDEILDDAGIRKFDQPGVKAAIKLFYISRTKLEKLLEKKPLDGSNDTFIRETFKQELREDVDKP